MTEPRARRGILEGVSLTQLLYFVAAAEERTLGRAAQRLHVSQPPLTRQLRSLEDELGTPLFERSRAGMKLLPAGQVFLEHARRVLADLDHAVDDTRRAARAPGSPAIRVKPTSN